MAVGTYKKQGCKSGQVEKQEVEPGPAGSPGIFPVSQWENSRRVKETAWGRSAGREGLQGRRGGPQRGQEMVLGHSTGRELCRGGGEGLGLGVQVETELFVNG